MMKLHVVKTENLNSFIACVVFIMITKYKPFYTWFLVVVLFDHIRSERFKGGFLYKLLDIIVFVFYLYLINDFIATIPTIYKDIVNYTLSIINNGI